MQYLKCKQGSQTLLPASEYHNYGPGDSIPLSHSIYHFELARCVHRLATYDLLQKAIKLADVLDIRNSIHCTHRGADQQLCTSGLEEGKAHHEGFLLRHF